MKIYQVKGTLECPNSSIDLKCVQNISTISCRNDDLLCRRLSDSEEKREYLREHLTISKITAKTTCQCSVPLLLITLLKGLCWFFSHVTSDSAERKALGVVCCVHSFVALKTQSKISWLGFHWICLQKPRNRREHSRLHLSSRTLQTERHWLNSRTTAPHGGPSSLCILIISHDATYQIWRSDS